MGDGQDGVPDMVIWVMMVSVATGAFATIAAFTLGFSWWIALLGYPVAGMLGGMLAGLALYLCRTRHQALTSHPGH